MPNDSEWIRFDEIFDESNGGCMYLRSCDEYGDDVQAAGVLWLDGDHDDLHYFACVAEFTIGCERYGDTQVNDFYDAAEAFGEIVDSEVVNEIGWFSTMGEATQAVEDAVETYLA